MPEPSPKSMSILALDVGDRRIGLAINEWADVVVPLTVIQRDGREIEVIRQLIQERGVEKIVVGLPLREDGTLSEQAQKILHFIAQLQKNLSLPIETVDERYTTVEAERFLIEADVSRARRKQVTDKLSAVFILKTYLSQVRRKAEG